MQINHSELNDIKYLTSLREVIELEIKIIDQYYEVLLKENKTYAIYLTNYMAQLQINLEYINNQIKTIKKTNNSVLSPESYLT